MTPCTCDPLATAAHSANGIEDDIILFLRVRQLKGGTNWSCYAIGIGVSVT